jgi:hypothetical protein
MMIRFRSERDLQNRGEIEKQTDRTNHFAGRICLLSGVLAGALAGCAAGVANRTRAVVHIRSAAESTEKKCDIGFVKGAEFVFRSSAKPDYRIKVMSRGKEDVTADITLPVAVKSGDSMISLKFSFIGVSLSCEALGSFLETIDGMYRLAKENAPKKKDTPATQPVLKGADVTKLLKTAENIAKSVLTQKEVTTRALSDLLAMRIGWPPTEDVLIGFTVAGSSKQEIMLSVKGGRYDGEKIRLDRRISVDIELEGLGSLSLPYKLEGLSVGPGGKIALRLAADCSGKRETSIVGQKITSQCH